MTFKVKDLMIDVSSAASAAQIGCTAHTLIGCRFYCTYVGTLCHYGCTLHVPSICTYASVNPTLTCPGSLVTDTSPIFQTINQLDTAGLANLKGQLKEALELAERQEVVQAQAAKLQTVAEAEMLEKKLAEALEDVRSQKADLQKKK